MCFQDIEIGRQLRVYPRYTLASPMVVILQPNPNRVGVQITTDSGNAIQVRYGIDPSSPLVYNTVPVAEVFWDVRTHGQLVTGGLYIDGVAAAVVVNEFIADFLPPSQRGLS